MSEISSLVVFLVFYLITIIGQSIGQHQPLIFDPFSLEIYDHKELFESTNAEYPSPYALACPSRYPHEMEFDQRYSLDNKSLILMYYFEKGQPIGDFTCAAEFKLAIAYHHVSVGKFIEFGYEIYYDPSEQDEDFKTTRYGAYKKVLATETTMKESINYLGAPQSSPITVKNTKINLMNFMWISKSILSYDHSLWTVKSVSYKVDAKAHGRKAECQDYSLGEQLYKKPYRVDDFYLETFQKDVFSVVQLPSSLPDDCKVRYDCVKKYTLTPSYVFQSSGSSDVVCSDLTTIPIWYETEKLLEYLKKFLSVIAMVTNNNVVVTDGTTGILELPLKDNGESKPIHLFAGEKRIPIPKTIYNTVSYRTYDCDDPENKLCWFGIMIVIHNEPEFTEVERICPIDECEKLGWESIQYASTDKNGKQKSKHIYCCAYHKAAHDELTYNKSTMVKRALSLKRFPYYNGKTHQNEYENRQAEFEAKMSELFPEVGVENDGRWIPVEN